MVLAHWLKEKDGDVWRQNDCHVRVLGVVPSHCRLNTAVCGPWKLKWRTSFLLGHCYYFLCFPLPARSFFRKYQKKNFLRNRPSCCPPAPSHTCLCQQVAWHDDWKPQSRRESRERHFQVVACTTKIVKGSFFKLQSSWGRSIKTEKMAFAIRWCMLEFFKSSAFAPTLEARQRRGRSTTTLRRSLLRQQRRRKVRRWSSPWSEVVNQGSSLRPVF